MAGGSKPDIHSLLGLLRSFSQAVLRDAAPELDDARCEKAYTSAIQAVCNHPCFTYFLSDEPIQVPELSARKLQLSLTHKCKFLGCHKSTCDLCKNNQEKKCMAGDNMDEYYIVNKAIKAKCGADVLVQLLDAETKEPVKDMSLQLQVSLTDGDRIEHPGQLEDLADIEIFVNKDSNNQPLLLTSNPVRRDSSGRLLISLQDSVAPLPEISVSFVTEKLRNENRNVKSFRLLICATNSPQGLQIEPALSCKFKVITQRAWNDRKASYPHVDDSVSRLDFIGKEAVRKLQNLDQELASFGFSLPSLACIQTVGQLKQLKEHMQQDHTLQSTIIRMLNLNHERWTNICHVLDERTVVSDNLPRAFFPPQQGAAKQLEGLFYKSRQAKVDLKNPDGLIEKVPTEDGRDSYVVTLFSSGSTALLHKKVEAWRSMAISCWSQDSHPGWRMAPDHGMQGTHGRSSPLRAANWGTVSTSTAGLLRSGFEMVGAAPCGHLGPPLEHPSPSSNLTGPFTRSTSSQKGYDLPIPNTHFEVSPHTGGYTSSSPTSTSMHEADERASEEFMSSSVNFGADQFRQPAGATLPRDSAHLSHFYMPPKRAHSKFMAQQQPQSQLIGDCSESAPEALPVADRVVVTANTSASGMQGHDAVPSAAVSSNTADPNCCNNTATFAAMQNATLFLSPNHINQALLQLAQGRQNINPNILSNLNPAMMRTLQELGQKGVNVEQLLLQSMAASHGLSAGMYTPHQPTPNGAAPPATLFTASPAPHQAPSPPRSSQNPTASTLYHTSPSHPQDPSSTSSSARFLGMAQSGPQQVGNSVPVSGAPSGSVNKQSNFHMPTAFGAPEMEGVLASIASFVPQRPSSQQQQRPNWQQQLGQHTHGLDPMRGQTQLAQQIQDHADGSGDRNIDMICPALMETPSFEFPTVVSETLMGLRPINNSLEAPLDSMPSISMLVSGSLLNQTNLSPTSSGMAWEAIVMEAAQNMAKLHNSSPRQQGTQQPVTQQQQAQWQQ